jgi:flavin reductase (DIM6/NTAB) family NADH-FMN oxidoreductase RutF
VSDEQAPENDAAEARDARYAVARTVLAELPCPVVLIAAEADGERSCATGTAMYVSFVPPALAIAVHPGSRTARLIEASGSFSISLLAEDQVDAAEVGGRSAPSGGDKLAATGLSLTTSPASTAPGADDAPLVAWCRVTHRHAAGDHVVYIGEVVDHQRAAEPAPPLLRHRRRYVRRGEWLTDEAPGGYPT